jgi:tetratricopeptide (TPR) repeat protein
MIGQYDRAIEDLSEAVRLAPENAIVHLNRGNVYARLGFGDQAIRDYETASRLNPSLIASYGGSSKLLEDMGRQSLAIHNNQLGSQADETRLVLAYERGNARRARGEWQAAIADFNEVLASDPNRAEAYVARGWSRLCAGEPGAEIDARTYLRLKGCNERIAPYMALLGFLSARSARKDEDAQAFLDDVTDKSSKDMWPQPVLLCFKRAISPASLLNSAKNEIQKTEAHTFLALDSLHVGDRKTALEHLRWVRDHGVSGSIASDLARATLERFDPTEGLARGSREGVKR